MPKWSVDRISSKMWQKLFWYSPKIRFNQVFKQLINFLITGNVAVNQTDNGFHFSISQSEKIVGISLTISSLEALNLDSFSVSNLMLAHCSLRRFSQNESQIVCSTSIVDLKKLPRVSWISIQFFDQFCIKNDSNCFQLMEFKLYQVGNDPDSCVILDTPPYGKIDKNPSSLNFEVKCKNGFIMDSNSLFIISCQSDEDEIRKVYASAKCHPENVCPLEETLSYIYAEYDYLWNWTHANVNCSVKYNCPDGHYLRGTSFRNCLKNGKWSGSQPLCIKKNQCKIIDMLYPTVSFVFGIIITIILFSLFKHLFINKYHVRK